MSRHFDSHRRAEDLGTPASHSDNVISPTIDGEVAVVPEGATVIRAADHLRRFWTPDMKRLIIPHAQRGRSELSGVAALAVAKPADEHAD